MPTCRHDHTSWAKLGASNTWQKKGSFFHSHQLVFYSNPQENGSLLQTILIKNVVHHFNLVHSWLWLRLTYFNFYSEILGVKFNNTVFWPGYPLIWSTKLSVNLSKLLASKKLSNGHFLNTLCKLSETFINPPIFNVFKEGNPSTSLFFPFYPIIKLLIPSSLIFSHPVNIIYYSLIHIPNLAINALLI